MAFEDPVWGKQKIEKEVIKQLIKTDPVQRLKNIQQAGPQKYFMDKNEVTRFQHSLGVFFLLRKFNASVEEQIAGLIHDTPHTAFSHVADFVFDTENHEYHERFMEEIIYESDIPKIVENHGYDIENVLDESKFKLLERDIPDICADRIDYFLRDSKIADESNIERYREALSVEDDLFVLSDKKTAEAYAMDYIRMDRAHWANPKEVAIFRMFADIIKRALETGELTEKELFGTDKQVYRKLRNIEDNEIEEKFRVLDSDLQIDLVENEEKADIVEETKARYVDPKVKTEDGVLKVSDYSRQVREEIEAHKREVNGGYNIRLVG